MLPAQARPRASARAARPRARASEASAAAPRRAQFAATLDDAREARRFSGRAVRALLGRAAELGSLPPRTLALLLLGPRVGGTKAYLEGLLEGLAPIILARLDEFNPHELFLLLSGWRRQARGL